MLALLAQQFVVNGAGVTAVVGLVGLLGAIAGAGATLQLYKDRLAQTERALEANEAERKALEVAFEGAIDKLRADFKAMLVDQHAEIRQLRDTVHALVTKVAVLSNRVGLRDTPSDGGRYALKPPR